MTLCDTMTTRSVSNSDSHSNSRGDNYVPQILLIFIALTGNGTHESIMNTHNFERHGSPLSVILSTP